MYNEALKKAVEERLITRLLHITNSKNMVSILNNGLIPYKTLDTYGVIYHRSDNNRFDRINGICLSIEEINTRYFNVIQKRNPNDDYIIIAISPSIIWEKECEFFYKNASSNVFKKASSSVKCGIDAFEKMFDEMGNKKRALNIESDTTDEQAEVICLQEIQKEKILKVITRKRCMKDKYNNIAIEYNPAMFSGRNKYLIERAISLITNHSSGNA